MLEPAQLHKAALYKEYVKIWYNSDYMFYMGWTGTNVPDLPDNNYDNHHFVSVDGNGNLIGYISYSVNWVAMCAYDISIISFKIGNIQFIRDVYHVICDLFEKYQMNRVAFFAYADNPAVRGYKNFVKMCGGRECGYSKQVAKLMDGKLHDKIEFEILSEDYKAQKSVKSLFHHCNEVKKDGVHNHNLDLILDALRKDVEELKKSAYENKNFERLTAFKQCQDLICKYTNVYHWIPVENDLPKDESEVYVVLQSLYGTSRVYSVARYLYFETYDESHWCDNYLGYLEWDKYSDYHGGCSLYRVIAWKPIEPYMHVQEGRDCD